MLRSTLFPLFCSPPPKTPAVRLLTSRTSLTRPPPVCRIASADLSTPPSLPPTSAYVHLPFCRKRCHYCDFPIIALGSPSSSFSSSSNYDDDPRVANYIALLIREIQATKPKPHRGAPLQTVFFGGGTPSLVPPRLVARVLGELKSQFDLCDNAEVSIEMDPGTFDAARLKALVGLGVGRVSLGVQAFQEELLRACGRAHGVREVHEAIEIVTGCTGIESWSMDLISSLPYQTTEMWEESLQCTINARPSHVSVYDLQIEQGTKFAHLYTPGEFPLPTESQSTDFYKMASETLSKAGYNHYEISSYCKRGYECKHNLTYWQNRSFYGFGLGAASYIEGRRFSRPRRLKEYMEYVQRLEDGLIDPEASSMDAKDMAMDVVMLSLRTAVGLDLKSFGRSFGKSLALSLCKAFRPYVQSGHVVAMDEGRTPLSGSDFELEMSNAHETENRLAYIRLSDPDGFLLSNELISIGFSVISP